MTWKQDIYARFTGEVDGPPLYVPDLTLWYEWHRDQGTLPDKWRGCSLPEIARAMGVPVWVTVCPWRVETPGVEVRTTEQADGGERIVRAETSAGTLVARWTLGPDGDWWQMEYPVKTADDLPAALELAEARSYVLDEDALAEMARLESLVGDDGILALEIPRRPYSDLLHEFLGWSGGLMLLGEPEVGGILSALEGALQQVVAAAAQLPGRAVLSPDNLDGQFISPRAFEEHLSESYRRTVQVLHDHGKRLVVHVGGPIKRLLAPLAAAGVDVIEGVAGPPQSDASLAEARDLAGPEVTLWGGIPQDFLLDGREWEELEAAVVRAVQDARSDGRMILGVADRMPVDAEMGRLEALPSLVERVSSG